MTMRFTTNSEAALKRHERAGEWCADGREYQVTINPPSEALV